MTSQSSLPEQSTRQWSASNSPHSTRQLVPLQRTSQSAASRQSIRQLLPSQSRVQVASSPQVSEQLPPSHRVSHSAPSEHRISQLAPLQNATQSTEFSWQIRSQFASLHQRSQSRPPHAQRLLPTHTRLPGGGSLASARTTASGLTNMSWPRTTPRSGGSTTASGTATDESASRIGLGRIPMSDGAGGPTSASSVPGVSPGIWSRRGGLGPMGGLASKFNAPSISRGGASFPPSAPSDEVTAAGKSERQPADNPTASRHTTAVRKWAATMAGVEVIGQTLRAFGAPPHDYRGFKILGASPSRRGDRHQRVRRVPSPAMGVGPRSC